MTEKDQTLRYDFSELDAIVRTMVITSLEEAEIAHEFEDDILSVGRKDEADVDEIITTWEDWGEQQREMRTHGEQAIAPGATPGEKRCELCSSSPAALITLRRQVGMIIVRSHYQSQLVLCDACGSALTKEFQKQTALKGWTGVLAAMTNPFVLASNARQRSKHRQALEGGDTNG